MRGGSVDKIGLYGQPIFSGILVDLCTHTDTHNLVCVIYRPRLEDKNLIWND